MASSESREVPPEKNEEVPKRAPKGRPDSAGKSTPRRLQRKAEIGSGRAPGVAPKWPEEVLQEGPKRPQQGTSEKPHGPRRASTECQVAAPDV